MNSSAYERARQNRYYADTARLYDSQHEDEKDEHHFALSFLIASVDYLKIGSILDVGSGTGRAIRYIKQCRPDLRVVGIEPVKELREVGHSRGLSNEDLIHGDATKIEYDASEFDLVCEFGVLHHIRTPSLAVSEMLRVAKKAIFISDSNNFGQGSLMMRSIKQTINFFGFWKMDNMIATRGKGYMFSAGDGLSYSYSAFNNYNQIRSQCRSIHILNTSRETGGINPYRTATHVALLGVKK